MSKFWKILCGILLLIVVIGAFFYFRYKPTSQPEWGLTFSYREAQGLGFDWKTMYLDMLDDLKPKHLRLMTYWVDFEPTRGNFDFHMADEQLAEAQKRNIKVVLVVGRKQPRWPECYEPGWFKDLSSDDQRQAELDYIKALTEHVKHYTAIEAWQVENEPEFSFGNMCPRVPIELLTQEVQTVKNIDSRPVILTDSGEIGYWVPTAKAGADIFGTTMYRVAYNSKYGGYYKYPLPAVFYRIKAGMLETFTKVNTVYDMELQMEPWFNSGAFNTPLDLQNSLMNPKVFQQNIDYAKGTDLSRHYLWGVEWWYWMAKKNNDWGMWQSAKTLLNS